MDEYKCISCGEIKESELPCVCSVCGYRMFKTPYNRRDLLISEIRSFVKQFEININSTGMFSHYRVVPSANNGSSSTDKTVLKQKDDFRFPVFDKIRDYVCSAKKTEGFTDNLNNSLDHIHKYLHEPFEQTYKTDFSVIKSRAENYDEVLKTVLEALDMKTELKDAVIPELVLFYSETPDEALLGFADELLNETEKLSAKISRFIKQNNIYGTAYKNKTKITFKPSENGNHTADFQNVTRKISAINAKKYIIDIFSDGSDELNEMLSALWNAVFALRTLPVLKKTYRYSFNDGTLADEKNICKMLNGIFQTRYTEIQAVTDAPDFLADCDENRLFELYNTIIELDVFGFTGTNKNNLLKIGESEEKLNALIGLSAVKESIKKIKAYALTNKDSEALNIHMCFYGNPGTGKTEVARIIAGILYENKILPTKKVTEVDRSGLVSQYFGATAEKTQQVIHRAMGGVLFIDEAYALANNTETTGISDYGKEAIDTLVKAMEDYRGKFCVIFAGYKNEMLNMVAANPGLRSRIQFELDFENFARPELQKIADLMLAKRKYTISETAMNKLLDITDVKRKEPNFANAREIRNIIDQLIMCQNIRCMGTDDNEIGIADINRYIQDSKIKLPTAGEGIEKKILTAEEELDAMIGLDPVKRMVKKIRAYAKRNCNQSDFNIHMCFYGNPGTGKTEVARIISRILYDAGVLSEAKLVETDSHGLIGKYVGETAPKTLAKINDAMNGVLFIDEAYGFVSSNNSTVAAASYGEEAVSVLLKEMEDRRGQLCVILAGYKDEMKAMLDSNPGFMSRIQFTLDFPDYSREELGEIALSFLAKKKYEIEEDALNLLLDITEYYRRKPNFANARTVRNILDQVIMNQNLRTEDTEDDGTIIVADVEDYITDEGIDLSDCGNTGHRIGFI